MRLFWYYAWHNIVNTIKKLFKTWVAIFLLICIAGGFAIGITVGVVISFVGEDIEDEIEDVLQPEEELTEEELAAEQARGHNILELAVGGGVLLILVIEILSADKSGASIFQPADVNILFTSPMKPQSVLFFRIMTQMGAAFILGIYLLLQLPNFVFNMGLGWWTGLSLILTFAVTFAVGRLLRTFLYMFTSTHGKLKKFITPVTLAAVVFAALAFVLYWKSGNDTALDAAFSFFNSPVSNYIPVWGWLKAITAFAVDGNLIGYLTVIAASLAVAVILIVAVWKSKADFYEDALAKTEETAELRRQAAESKGWLTTAAKKKDRADRFSKWEYRYGNGANVYFFKAMYNRFRFGHAHFFTKSGEFYLIIGVGIAALLRFAFHTTTIIPVAVAFSMFAFFRALGNPLSQDLQVDSYALVPESSWAKYFWSLLGGTANCFLDVFPAFAISALFVGADPLESLAWVLFIVTFDFYSSNVGAFIDLSIPVSVSKGVKQAFQIMFIYFGMGPAATAVVLGAVSGYMGIALLIASVFNVGVGALLVGLNPLFIEKGRK